MHRVRYRAVRSPECAKGGGGVGSPPQPIHRFRPPSLYRVNIYCIHYNLTSNVHNLLGKGDSTELFTKDETMNEDVKVDLSLQS